MDLRISEARARALAKALSSVGLERVMRLEDLLDPQLAAASEVARRWGAGTGALCAALTALISYRLAMRGEEWWACYRDFFSAHECPGDPRGAVDAVSEFASSCRGAMVARDAKLRRLRRALGAAEVLRELSEGPERVLLEGYGPFLASLARALGQGPDDKTIVFSLKMAYYACRGSRCPGAALPMDVPLPVDLRVSCVSYSSGLLDVPPGHDPVAAIMSRPEVARAAWSEVARGSGIPPLHIDTLIWLSGRWIREAGVEEARRSVAAALGPILGRELSSSLAAELAWRPCGGKGHGGP